jgi:2-phospho-L-lactate/phosphoenolpyruvate guanylyltransferase
VSCFVVMAVRPVDEGKSRLASTLDADQRKLLNIKMFRHVFEVVRKVVPAGNVVVISRSEALLDEARAGGAIGQKESGSELNAALTEASRIAVERGATSLLTLSSDLPFLEADDVRALIEAEGDVVIATDRPRIGTNALLMRRPFAMPYRYGGESLVAHKAAAAEAGLIITVVERPGLARDIDTPADLEEYRLG